MMTYRVKNLNKSRVPDPTVSFFKAADKFRHRRRFSKFVKMKDFCDYITTSKKKDFKAFVKSLEDFRCDTIGMGEDKFYALVSEFLLQPNEQYYYNPAHLFGCKGSYVEEEFRSRILQTIPLIARAVGENNDTEGTTKFISRINDLNTVVDVKSAGLFGQKDWFCVKAIQAECERRGWSEDEFLSRAKRFYQRRIRKVYPEMLLNDFATGQLDHVKGIEEIAKESLEKVRKKKPKHIQAIEAEPWYSDWEKGITT